MDPKLQEKITKFEWFINDVLKSDLAKLQEKLDGKNEEIAEFLQLKAIINTLKNNCPNGAGFKTKVDLGNNFFVQAKVEDTSNILLDVGLGHFVEFTLEEALTVIDVRIKLFKDQIANLRKQIAMTNAHIKLMLLDIRELQGIK